VVDKTTTNANYVVVTMFLCIIPKNLAYSR